MVPRFRELWQNRKEEVRKSADLITSSLQDAHVTQEAGVELSKVELDKCANNFIKDLIHIMGGSEVLQNFQHPINIFSYYVIGREQGMPKHLKWF